ncbi:hypothetical protein DSL72_006831 [Monilinia vaccinii-corymbosi]|uniref:Uncharacterized protein n=1 Tax=Monilinia vaccinii-corymbosi TaxID=61207 RepID=A0A8A3PL60_9HELO|nr:hypothetical protein DSL72_006831 [Monilinia vaccinii-corymbosi]
MSDNQTQPASTSQSTESFNEGCASKEILTREDVDVKIQEKYDEIIRTGDEQQIKAMEDLQHRFKKLFDLIRKEEARIANLGANPAENELMMLSLYYTRLEQFLFEMDFIGYPHVYHGE